MKPVTHQIHSLSPPRWGALRPGGALPPSRAHRPSAAGVAPMLVLVLLWLGLLLALPSCAPGSLKEFLDQGELPYARLCKGRAKDFRHRVKELQYNRNTLEVYRWTHRLPGGKYATLEEEDFVDELVAGKARFVLVTARGGVGKSTLARAVQAQACGRLPTFLVDLRADVASRLEEAEDVGNLVLGAVEHQLGIQADAQRRDAFRERLARGAFLLILDALDEVPIDVRPKIVEHVLGVRTAFPRTAQIVVFARPSVFSAHYGLKGLDARVELPELTCGRTKAQLDWTTEDDAERARLKKFIKVYSLDEENKKRGRCHLPYLSTYRDIQVAQRLARTFNPKSEMGGLHANLATVHERIVAERLRKELAFLQWDQATALAAIDKVVRVHGREDGEWNLEFTARRCIEAQGGAKNAKTRWICEKILQSALFSRIPGVKEWAFSHRYIADLFLARWLDREIGRTGGCDVVDVHAAWIADKRVAGYLLGQPMGRHCLFEVAKAVCGKHGFDRKDVALYYRGLPVGGARKPLVTKALDKAAKSGDRCAYRTIHSL